MKQRTEGNADDLLKWREKFKTIRPTPHPFLTTPFRHPPTNRPLQSPHTSSQLFDEIPSLCVLDNQVEPAEDRPGRQTVPHTPSIAFRHPPPNSARFSYATEVALFYLRAAVHRRGQRPPKGSGTVRTVETTHTPTIAFRHLPSKEGCRKPVLRVSKQPSAQART